MAQTGYTPIVLYASGTATNTPIAGNLASGELAINYADGKLFYKDSSGVVQVLATKDATSGSFTNLAYTGTLTGGTGVVNLGSGQFYKDASGNVGIGTASPSTYGQFAVVGNSTGNIYQGSFVNLNAGNNTTKNSSIALILADTTGTPKRVAGFTAYPDNANVLTGGLAFNVRKSDSDISEAMRIDSSGNVGIGTSSPNNQGSANNTVLQLNGKTTGALGFIRTANSDNSVITDFFTDGTTAAGFVSVATNHPLIMRTNNTERMRIDSSGNVKVNNVISVASGDPSWGASGNFGESSTSGIAVNAWAGSAFFTGNIIYSYTNSSGTGFNFYKCNSAAGLVFYIRGDGNVYNLNNSYGAVSDVKLKENIVDATPKLEDLCKVKVRQYNLKSEPNQKQIGVVAQELEEVFAGLVEETADKDAKGNDLGTTTKSVKYSVFVPMLIKAIQEQQALIESLTTRLTALENK